MHVTVGWQHPASLSAAGHRNQGLLRGNPDGSRRRSRGRWGESTRGAVVDAGELSRGHLGARVQVTRQYGYGPHRVLGELQRVDHRQECTIVGLNVLGEQVVVQLEDGDEVEVHPAAP